MVSLPRPFAVLKNHYPKSKRSLYGPHDMPDALQEFIQQFRGAVPQTFLEIMRVFTGYLGYNKCNTVKAIGPLSARKTMIRSEHGTVSVEDYFRQSESSESLFGLFLTFGRNTESPFAMGTIHQS